MLRPSKLITNCLVAGLLIAGIACEKSNNATTTNETIPNEVIQKISKMGFSTANARKVPEGYVVEGDILLKPSDLDVNPHSPILRIAEVEQYRSYNLVTSLPRTITLSISGLPATYTTAADNAIARYNTLNLRITFQRVASGGQIDIQYASLGSGILGRSAGFPSSAGEPATPILLNSDWDALGPSPEINFLTTVITHEIGHAIGFRHTDYFNRGFSGCLVDATHPANEGTAPDGAIHLNGTPTTGDNGSWMLACIGIGVDRPFNFNDLIALRGLYGTPSPSCGTVEQRIINGVCETGWRRIISTEYDDFHDRCYISYFLQWSNGEIAWSFGTREPGQCP